MDAGKFTALQWRETSQTDRIVADFSEDDKPWRRPGTDMTDYFNYGFDEFTWASYCYKQELIPKEAANEKKHLDDMQNFLGMPGIPGALPGAMPGMGGPGEMPQEMMTQMMQQMMASGMDPSQMSPEIFMQYMAQAGQGAGGQGGMSGAQGYGQQGQGQQQGYGYGGGGGGGGRGRGRRNW